MSADGYLQACIYCNKCSSYPVENNNHHPFKPHSWIQCLKFYRFVVVFVECRITSLLSLRYWLSNRWRWSQNFNKHDHVVCSLPHSFQCKSRERNKRDVLSHVSRNSVPFLLLYVQIWSIFLSKRSLLFFDYAVCGKNVLFYRHGQYVVRFGKRLVRNSL